MNTKKIIYYGRGFERDYFRDKGWRGRLILILHSIWTYLGRKIEYHTMILVTRRHNLGKDTERALIQTFHEEDSGDIKDRRKSILSSFGIGDIRFTEKESRYSEGRKNGPVIEDRVQQKRQEEADQTSAAIARMMAHKRDKSYTIGRDRFSVQEVHAEPIVEGLIEQTTPVSRREEQNQMEKM